MKKTLTILVLTLLFSSSELLSQSSWIDKGEYLQMENTPASIRDMKLSSDESKLLIISDTSSKDDIAEYIEIDMASGGEVYKKQINYPRTYSLPSCLLPDRRFMYQSDSLTVSGMNLTTGDNYFSIDLESVKEFGDSLLGYSEIAGIYPWHDSELFCVTITTYYKPVKYKNKHRFTYDYGITGNYYFIDRNGVVIFKSGETGAVQSFIPGKDSENYKIMNYKIDFRKFGSSVIGESGTKFFIEDSVEIESKYNLMTFNPELNIMVTDFGGDLQFWDMADKKINRVMNYTDFGFNRIESVRILNSIACFIVQGYDNQGSTQISIFDIEQLVPVNINVLENIDDNTIRFMVVGNSCLLLKSQTSLFKIKQELINPEISVCFSISDFHVLENSAVNFFGYSNAEPDSWLWDFGDGTTSNDKQPVHVFKEPGEYTVSLTVYKGGDSSMYISGHPMIVHKVLNPIISVSPLAGIPPFEISVENMTEDGEYISYIRVGDEPNWYEQDQVLDTITGSGDIYAWLTLSDSVFIFIDYKIVKSAEKELESDIFTIDRLFPEESISSAIETIVLGNNDNLVFSCRHNELSAEDLSVTKTYYTINSIDKDFTNFKTIKSIYNEIDMIKLINGNYLILNKTEKISIFEIDENGVEISKDKIKIADNRKIISVKQGPTGRFFVENQSINSQYINCFNQNAEELWEIETKDLLSYLPLRNGGLAIGYDEFVYFDTFMSLPVGVIEMYDEAGVSATKKQFETEYFGWESGSSLNYPHLLYELGSGAIVYKHSYEGTIHPRYARIISTTDDVFFQSTQYYMLGDVFFITDEIWFREKFWILYVGGTGGNMLMNDTLNGVGFNSAVYDKEYAYFAGNRRASILPRNTFKTDAYLAKTKKISTLTSISEAPAATAPGLQISPNPASDKLKVSINLNSADRVNLEILDINGNHINSVFQGYMSPGQQEISADLSDYPVGAYIIRLIAGRNVYSGKLIVKR